MLLPLKIRIISPAKRHCMGVYAVENGMLFILDIIISLTQITGRGGTGVPCCGLTAKGEDTQHCKGRSRNMYLGRL
jgi:hypothetical protein